MDSERRAKRQKLDDHSSTSANLSDANAQNTTPRKNLNERQAPRSTGKENVPLEHSPIIPLSRTLGMFKKYHRPTPPISPQRSPISAWKGVQTTNTPSPTKSAHSPNDALRSISLASPSKPKIPSLLRKLTEASRSASRQNSKETTIAHKENQSSRRNIGDVSDSLKRQREDSAVSLSDKGGSSAGLTPTTEVSRQLPEQRIAAWSREDALHEVVHAEQSGGRQKTITEKLREVRRRPAQRTQQPQQDTVTPQRLIAERSLASQGDELGPSGERGDAEVICARDLLFPIDCESPVEDLPLSETQMLTTHDAVLSRLTHKTPIPIMNLSEPYARTSALIEQTITAGESNSMLVIGSRGVGKSTMINQIITEQQAKHADDFLVVRLNGFIHTDDKLALRDIWRQLGREMEIDSSTYSYADTMSMLLALLSHPTDLDQTLEAGAVAKSVIFILDEFDLFATHPRQTLLYNLFDIAQSRRAPIAVLGLTTRVDAAEQLEKRVKSRFSHRYVHLGLVKSLEAYTAVCKSILVLDGRTQGPQAVSAWNVAIEGLFGTRKMKEHVGKLYYRSKSVPDFMMTMLVPMATLPREETTTPAIVEHISASLSMTSLGTSKLEYIASLPIITVAMLVCAARQAIYSIEHVSFDIAYEEYKALAAKMKLQATASGALAVGRVWAKEVARVAWLDLVELGYVMDGRIDISLTELAECGVDLGQWLKWCKEI